MKREIFKLSVVLIVLIAAITMLNMKVHSKQGVNYKVHTIDLPLYLKALDFFDRHFNYVQLVKSITYGVKSDEDKVIRMFEWTFKNIRRIPQGLPIMDDHVWYTIVRGYGVDEQFSDVFTTLCSYAGQEAMYLWVQSKNSTSKIPLSFIKIKKAWFVFDPYRGVYFIGKDGRLADIEVIKLPNQWTPQILNMDTEIDYSDYFLNLPSPEEKLNRANIQSPWRRFVYELSRVTH